MIEHQESENLTRVAAQVAAEVVERATAAATSVARTASEAAAALAATTSQDIQYIKNDINEIKLRLDNKYVSKETFIPVQNLVYGMVSVMLITVVGGLMTLLLKR